MEIRGPVFRLEYRKESRMKAALYLRVANDDQSEALFTQEFYLRDWANKQGYEVTSVFHDMAPGTSLDRPGLQELLSELNSGQFDVVLTRGTNRLIRNLHLAPELAETFRSAGIRVISPLESDDVFESAPWFLVVLNAEYNKPFCKGSTPK